MARGPEAFLNRVLRRGEDIGLFATAAALVLIEAGYVAWLERLPVLPGPSHPVGFLVLPPWYDRPRVEVTDNPGRIDRIRGLWRFQAHPQQRWRAALDRTPDDRPETA